MYRNTFSFKSPACSVSEFKCTANRPTLELEEELQEDGSYKLVGQHWKPLTTTIKAVSPDGETLADLKPLYDYVAGLYDPVEANPADYVGTGCLRTYEDDEVLEEWTFDGMSTASVNFGELVYTSSQEMNVEVSWRFNGCQFRSFRSEN